jgi:hypothetical protein
MWSMIVSRQIMDTIEPGIVNWKKVNIDPKNR